MDAAVTDTVSTPPVTRPDRDDRTAPTTPAVGSSSRPVATAAPEAPPARAAGNTAAAAVLVATDVAKSFRRGVWPRRQRRPVLRGANLTLHPGEVVGLVGENGSGKSTLMKILVGELAADAGTVRRSGRLGYCPQEPLVYARLTCDEHFELFGQAYAMSEPATKASRDALYATLGFARYGAPGPISCPAAPAPS